MRVPTLARLARAASLLVALSACAQKPTITAVDSSSTGGTPPSGGVPNAPELPRTYLDTHYSPPSGNTISVPQGGDLQAALNAAQPCDVISLAAGAVFTGTFTLPAKSGSCWITIRSSAPDASLPAEGVRMKPSFANLLPKIVTSTSQPAVQTALGAHHYRIMDVEITAAASVTVNYGLVTLGRGTETALSQLPTDIILDRVYVHGTATVELSRCVALNSVASAVIDSYLSECHAKGIDSQAIAGWNGPGPFKIVNNYMEGAAETLVFGGGDPTIANLTPADIEIRHNHFTRPTAWKGVWMCKNLFELKNARRVLAEGNVLENNWADAQVGFALVWKSVNQNGGAPWSVTRDVTFRYNRIRNSGAGVNIAAHPETYPVEPLSRILIYNNVFENTNIGTFNGQGRLYQILDGPAGITIVHNTSINLDNAIAAIDAAIMMDMTPPQSTGFVFRDNVVVRGQYGVYGGGAGEGMAALTKYMTSDYVFQRNLIIGANGAIYPANNSFPVNVAALGLIDPANGNYRFATSSPFARSASDGSDPGANIDAVEKATAGAVSP